MNFFSFFIYIIIVQTCLSNFQIEDTRFGNVPVRVYDPIGRDKNSGAVMWFHGGGWVIANVGK